MSTELETRPDHPFSLTRFAAGHGRIGVQITDGPNYVGVTSRDTARALALDLLAFAHGIEQAKQDEPREPASFAREAEQAGHELDRFSRETGHRETAGSYARSADRAYSLARDLYRVADRPIDADRCAAAAAIVRGRALTRGY